MKISKNNTELIQMSKDDYLGLLCKKIKIITNKEVTIGNKTSNEFWGYILKLYTGDPPNNPLHIRFIDESISDKINSDIEDNLAKGINIFDIESLELLD